LVNSILKLKDGRDYDHQANDVDGKSAILFHHGTPGDCTVWASWISGLSTVQALAASRPGYSLSSRRRGRNVASDIDNNSELLDHYGIEKFVSIGWSGGGPHALNMTRHPKNVGAITLAGVGKWGNDDLNFLAGMGAENHEEFGAALACESAIEEWMI
jgi:pimeloyl-ACP methyl ester carboxylesterase